MKNKIIIECGANLGHDTERLHQDNPDAMIFTFEPTIELFTEVLYPKFRNNKNVKIFPFAIDSNDGFTKFNVAGQADWGCSSLYEFSDDIHEKWPGRPDFKVTHSYLVPTISLFNFCKAYDIEEIDFLWIDTQGNDFNVLKSLREKIKNVKAGRCEVSLDVELYKNTDNKLNTVKAWLEENGFKVEVNAHGHNKEADLNFYK